ncbi:MAG: sigma-54-dependent transcriptional regulator [Anaerovoracaceae bacterium]|jgi:two-component system response regulator HydG
MAKLKILVVDDQQDHCEVIKMILESKGYKVMTRNSGQEALALLKDSEFDLLITDLSMPEMDGIELLGKAKEMGRDIQVILLTAYGTIERAVEAMKLGAYSYVTKGNDPEELLHEVSKLEEMKKIQAENQRLKVRMEKNTAMLQTKNQEFQKLLDLAGRAAKSDSSILIYGESGCGKEVLASYIYENSLRKGDNFMELNCQALSESLLESELFGHEKGAFTGADRRHIGLFEASGGGTLFLDEIGGISPKLQSKLLKVIENKRVYRLGSTRPIETDFRLITATNRNLWEDMEQDLFRSDLFYRISTIVLEIPPLRNRREDIPLFIDYFLELYQREMKKTITSVEDEVSEFLREYHYPGNIRELKNIIERMVVLSDDGVIRKEYLPGDLSRDRSAQAEDLPDSAHRVSLRDYRGRAETRYISYLVKAYEGDLDQVSQVLGITRRQLFNKMKMYNIER